MKVRGIKRRKMDYRFEKGLGVGVLAGAVVGVVVGVLTAPKSGKDTRDEIKLKTRDTINNIKERVNNIEEQASQSLRDYIQEKIKSHENNTEDNIEF